MSQKSISNHFDSFSSLSYDIQLCYLSNNISQTKPPSPPTPARKQQKEKENGMLSEKAHSLPARQRVQVKSAGIDCNQGQLFKLTFSRFKFKNIFLYSSGLKRKRYVSLHYCWYKKIPCAPSIVLYTSR